MSEEPALSAWCRIDRNLRITKIQVRDAADAAGRLAALLCISAPAPGRFAETKGYVLAAIAPGEWLLFSDDADAAKMIGRIETAMSGNTALITDITAGVVALRLSGRSATACLAAYTALDLRDRAMPTGTAVRTRFGDIGVFLARILDTPEYLLIADQSYTPYLRALVTHGPPHR